MTQNRCKLFRAVMQTLPDVKPEPKSPKRMQNSIEEVARNVRILLNGEHFFIDVHKPKLATIPEEDTSIEYTDYPLQRGVKQC